jgi:lysophospholipase L1-like esterase
MQQVELKMKKSILSLLSSLSVLSTASVAAAETAYLRPGEVIVCVGDSVTHAGVYDGFLQAMLDRLYPEAGIRVVNRGQGGQTSGAAVALLDSALKTERPTLATFMFGVNDTRWSAGDQDAKAEAFVAGLTAAVDLAEKNQVVPLLLRESHFSHSQAPDDFSAKVNGVLDRLMAAQDAFAAERQVPVIDTQGAYKRALAAAWAADPRYEFSPDIVHPNSAGHAALAGEILRALGAGLPLAEAKGERGPLRLTAPDDLTIEFTPAAGVLAPDGTLAVPVTLHNRSAQPEKGALVLCLPDHLIETPVEVAAGASATVTCDLPLAKLRPERSAGPLYAAFRGESRFTAASTLFFHSRLRPAAAAPVVFRAADFQSAAAEDARVCPVSHVAMQRNGTELTVEFTWADTTVVPARAGFKTRFGMEITALLDLNNREGQPCDAVEFFLDQRPADAIGRPTANADANPEGILRIGVCFVEENGKPVARALSLPELPDEALSLVTAGPNAWTLKVTCAPAGPSLGVSMRVTDNTEFKVAATPPFWLTGHRGAGQEPLGYVQLGAREAGFLYRVGY